MVFPSRYKEEFAPQKDHPKVENTSLIAPEVWETMPPEHFRYALKQSLIMSLNDWSQLLRWIIPIEKSSDQMKTSTATSTQTIQDQGPHLPGDDTAHVKEESAKEPTILLTRDEAKQVASHVARKLTNLSQDEELRKQLVGLGTQALNTARDCLDQFLIGYQEGKNEEIRAFISEQMEKEEEFVNRIKKVRDIVEEELKYSHPHSEHLPNMADNNLNEQQSLLDSHESSNREKNKTTTSSPVDSIKSLGIMKNAEDLTSEIQSIWKNADSKVPPKN